MYDPYDEMDDWSALDDFLDEDVRWEQDNRYVANAYMAMED